MFSRSFFGSRRRPARALCRRRHLPETEATACTSPSCDCGRRNRLACANDLIWSKLDPPPESPRNRWRCGHEHVLFLTKRPGKYTFNADAIRVPYADATVKRWGRGQVYGGPKSEARPNDKASRMRHGKAFKLNPKGCLPTDVWMLPAGDSAARHYATFPDRLVRPIILACSNPGGLVIDPFVGSGTTCRIAKENDRRFLGIELNPEYAKMTANSVGVPVEYVEASGPVQHTQVAAIGTPGI